MRRLSAIGLFIWVSCLIPGAQTLTKGDITAAPLGEAGSQPAGEAVPAASEAVTISNSFFETDLRQALQDIAVSLGQTIIVAPEVQGYVTLELKNVPFDKALRLMLAGTGYMVKKTPDYYLVCSPEPTSKAFLEISETRILRLNYITAESALKLLAPPLQSYVQASPSAPAARPAARAEEQPYSYSSSGRSIGMSRVQRSAGFAQTLTADNLLSVTAPPSILERIVSDLLKIDQRPRQIMLDARIVVLESEALLNLGIEWSWPQVSAGAFSDSDLGGAWPWGIRIGYNPAKEFTNSLMMTLNLLSENNEATVLANPQVLAQDGKPAQISVTNEEYFEILTRGYYSMSELEKIEVGTILTITPRIGEHNEITMAMSTEVSDVVARAANKLPVVTRRTTDSTVRVDDGGTAVVAGLVDNRARLTKKQVPGLGSIPFLGIPFQNDNNSDTTRQVAVFITPRLLLEEAEAPEAPEAPVAAAPTPIQPVGEEFKDELKKSLERMSWNRMSLPADQKAAGGALNSGSENKTRRRRP